METFKELQITCFFYLSACAFVWLLKCIYVLFIYLFNIRITLPLRIFVLSCILTAGLLIWCSVCLCVSMQAVCQLLSTALHGVYLLKVACNEDGKILPFLYLWIRRGKREGECTPRKYYFRLSFHVFGMFYSCTHWSCGKIWCDANVSVDWSLLYQLYYLILWKTTHESQGKKID